MGEVRRRAEAILGEWAAPEGLSAVAPAAAGAAAACRTFVEAVTGVACPLPMTPDEADRLVALARRNREYSAAHTDAMLPGDPPLLPRLLAHAAELDARERAALAGRIAEWERRERLGSPGTELEDARLAAEVREVVLRLAPEPAAALCLLHGLDGRRPMRPHEAATALATDDTTIRRLAADGLATLRESDSRAALRAARRP